MKLLHVIPSVGPLRGGPSFVVRTISEGLAERGYDVHVATTDDNGAGRLSVRLGSPVIEKKVTYWYFRRQTSFYTFSWPLSRWLAQNVSGFDAVHIHALFSYPMIPAAYWAAHFRVPYIVRPLGTLNRWGIENRRPWLKRLSLRLIDGPVLSHASAVHYTSEDELQEASLVARAGRSVVIPNPVDFQFASAEGRGRWLKDRYPATAGKKIVLFLSRLDPKKGLDLLITAFAKIREKTPDVALVIVGGAEGTFLKQLQAQADRLAVGTEIIWTGFLEGADKRAALAGADVFVLPSYSENFGVAAVEAMAAGLPLVVSDHVGIHREIATAGAGLVVPCNAEELSNAVLRLTRDESLRQSMSANASMLAQTFSRGPVTERLIQLYDDVVGSNGKVM